MAQRRGLTELFMDDLQDGPLTPLLQRVRKDTSLDLQIRGNYLNVYYRGGSILHITPTKKTLSRYRFKFDKKYFSGSSTAVIDALAPIVAKPEGCNAWIAALPVLKDTMDLWFGNHPKDERALQQMVVWENNDSPWAGGTDYFIVDIEYDSRKGDKTAGGRFDLIAIKWESSPAARKLKGKARPKLVVIEMKAGDGALKGSAGMLKHWQDFEKLSKTAPRTAFLKEMVTVFAQKRDLGLIRSLAKHTNEIKPHHLDPQVEFMFLLAGHDPASRKLKSELDALNGNPKVDLCTSNFTGFALYKEDVCPLPQFLDRYKEQI